MNKISINQQVEGTAVVLENQTSFSSLESKYRDCHLKNEANSAVLEIQESQKSESKQNKKSSRGVKDF